jgi:hypothetical protein
MTTLASSVAETLLSQFLAFAQLSVVCMYITWERPPFWGKWSKAHCWAGARWAHHTAHQHAALLLACRTEGMLLRIPPMRKPCRRCRLACHCSISCAVRGGERPSEGNMACIGACSPAGLEAMLRPTAFGVLSQLPSLRFSRDVTPS